MKNILTILFFLISIACLGQKRSADCRVEFVYPTPDSTVRSPVSVPVQFKIVNQGPDSLFASDTLVYRLNHSMPSTSVLTRREFGVDLGPNDSIVINESVYISKNIEKKFNVLIPTFGFFSPPADPRYLETEVNEQLDDNQAWVWLYNLPKPSSVESSDLQDVFLYPNPANQNTIHIKGLDEPVLKLTVKDLNGKQVLLQRNLKESYLDVSEFSNGLYYITIITDEYTFNRKMVIEK